MSREKESQHQSPHRFKKKMSPTPLPPPLGRSGTSGDGHFSSNIKADKADATNCIKNATTKSPAPWLPALSLPAVNLVEPSKGAYFKLFPLTGLPQHFHPILLLSARRNWQPSNEVSRMRVSVLSLFVLALLLIGARSACGDLAGDINAVLADPLLSHASAGIQIVRLGKSESISPVLVQSNPTTPFTPASNLKVVTTSAALGKTWPGFHLPHPPPLPRWRSHSRR